MHFWASSAAAPSAWLTLPFVSRTPRILRPDPPAPISPTWNSLGTVMRLDISHNRLLADFLHAHYCGPDWTLSSDVYDWIDAYLRDPTVVVMGLVGATDRRLYASIVSTPVSGDPAQGTYMSHGGRLEGRALRVIEGLCIHTEYRGRGLAGFMIYQIDMYTATMYDRAPVVHLWSREESSRPWLLSTALLTETYAYAPCGRASATAAVRQIPWDEFTRLWAAADWYTDTAAHVRTAVPNNRRGALVAYRHEDKIIIVSNTGRITRPAHRGDSVRRIYEVVWCGLMRGGQLVPPGPTAECQRALDAVRGVLGMGEEGILFARSAPTGGGASAEWSSSGWVFGRSGVHSWYMYNYVPPAFQTCLLHIVREEL